MTARCPSSEQWRRGSGRDGPVGACGVVCSRTPVSAGVFELNATQRDPQPKERAHNRKVSAGTKSWHGPVSWRRLSRQPTRPRELWNFSPRQDHRPPRVIRVTFPLMLAAYTSTVSYKYRALKILAFSPIVTASWEIRVRRASSLPSASFRFHLAVDTLAVRLIVPLVGPTADLHRQVIRPPPHVPEQRHAWRTKKNGALGRTPQIDKHLWRKTGYAALRKSSCIPASGRCRVIATPACECSCLTASAIF